MLARSTSLSSHHTGARPSISSSKPLRAGTRLAATKDGACYFGMDFGTSGARGTVINADGKVLADVKQGYGTQPEKDWAGAWERALYRLIADVPQELKAHVAGVAFDGTSATAMLLDRASGRQLAQPRLYNEAMGADAVAAAKAMAPPAHTATAATSTLCKLLAWHAEGVWQAAAHDGAAPGLLHQADWLASLLHEDRAVTDWNNALKLGFDPESESYPEWLTSQPFAHLLPARVVAPGAPAALLTQAAAERTGLPTGCIVAGGTTDSIAAFVAANVTEPGHGVTSLGSTMAVKMLSTTRVDDAAFGVYSHRLGNGWLVGGASNTGGAVLRAHFTDAQLAALTERIDVSKPSGLAYYPLTKPGERFPVNDPALAPRLSPRPEDDALFLHGMLESMARIEADAYRLLHTLGARPAVSLVQTAGGGAVNAKWMAMRHAAIGVPVVRAQIGDASYGAALLARQACHAQAAVAISPAAAAL